MISRYVLPSEEQTSTGVRKLPKNWTKKYLHIFKNFIHTGSQRITMKFPYEVTCKGFLQFEHKIFLTSL